jgi:hypothetical protein
MIVRTHKCGGPNRIAFATFRYECSKSRAYRIDIYKPDDEKGFWDGVSVFADDEGTFVCLCLSTAPR